jgi:hypothetical protein
VEYPITGLIRLFPYDQIHVQIYSNMAHPAPSKTNLVARIRNTAKHGGTCMLPSIQEISCSRAKNKTKTFPVHPKTMSALHPWLIPLIPWEAEIRRIKVQGQPGQIVPRLHLQNNQSKMNWRYGSSSRAPALQAWSPEFKLQSHKKTSVIVVKVPSVKLHHPFVISDSHSETLRTILFSLLLDGFKNHCGS